MPINWRFDKKSFVIFLILFIIEVLIAIFVKDNFVRPYLGDVLVVILMYYFVKTFAQIKPLYLASGAVIFAYLVEISQYLKLVEVLGLQGNVVMRTVLGSSFEWYDMLAYTVGGVICYLIDREK